MTTEVNTSARQRVIELIAEAGRILAAEMSIPASGVLPVRLPYFVILVARMRRVQKLFHDRAQREHYAEAVECERQVDEILAAIIGNGKPVDAKDTVPLAAMTVEHVVTELTSCLALAWSYGVDGIPKDCHGRIQRALDLARPFLPKHERIVGG
jgi:hypothetical protein